MFQLAHKTAEIGLRYIWSAMSRRRHIQVVAGGLNHGISEVRTSKQQKLLQSPRIDVWNEYITLYHYLFPSVGRWTNLLFVFLLWSCFLIYLYLEPLLGTRFCSCWVRKLCWTQCIKLYKQLYKSWTQAIGCILLRMKPWLCYSQHVCNAMLQFHSWQMYTHVQSHLSPSIWKCFTPFLSVYGGIMDVFYWTLQVWGPSRVEMW